MKKTTFKDVFDFKFTLIIIFYLFIGSILISFYRYQISPDSISYISLAQKYLRGDFSNAINGCWAPLLSWLLIPLLFFGIDPLLASVILTFIFGLFTLMAAKLFSKRFDLSEKIRTAILISLVPIILAFAFFDSASDFFVVLFLLLYFNVVFDNHYPNRKRNGILCGIYGSLAYFSKAFALPFFIVHFALFNVIHYYKTSISLDRRKVISHSLYGFLVFFLICGVWITIISIKYNQVTFSTAGKFNYLAAGPESQSRGGPFYYQGLFVPTNETAVSGWEDPTFHEMPEWSPFESWELFKYQIRTMIKNTDRTLQKFNSFSSLSCVILIFYVLLAIAPRKKIISRSAILYPLMSMFLYCSGYIIIVVERRYLWINAILLIFMGGHLLHLLFESGYFNKMSKNLLILFFATTFILPSIRYLKSNINTKKDVYHLSKTLENKYGITGNIAANKHQTTFYISYHIGARYFGRVKPNQTEEELQKELSEHDIDYYFVWGSSNEHKTFLSNFLEVTKGDIPGLKIYSLKEHSSIISIPFSICEQNSNPLCQKTPKSSKREM